MRSPDGRSDIREILALACTDPDADGGVRISLTKPQARSACLAIHLLTRSTILSYATLPCPRATARGQSKQANMFSETAWTFLISVFNPFGFFVIIVVTIVRSFLSLDARVDALIGVLLNLPAGAFWVSWLARSSETSMMTNDEIGSTIALYIFGGLGVGWILGVLIRRVLVRFLISIG